MSWASTCCRSPAHKFYGPKGVGVLYVREGTKLEPFMHGAGHEGGRRAGTENVLLDVGLGAAAGLAADLAWTQGVRELRDRMWDRLRERWGDRVVLNGHPVLRLPNTLNVSFVGDDGRRILAAMPEVAASTGSACHSGGTEPSPVLAAMGVSREVGAGARSLQPGAHDDVGRAGDAARAAGRRRAGRRRLVRAATTMDRLRFGTFLAPDMLPVYEAIDRGGRAPPRARDRALRRDRLRGLRRRRERGVLRLQPPVRPASSAKGSRRPSLSPRRCCRASATAAGPSTSRT